MSQSQIITSEALNQDVDITNVSQNTLPRLVPIRFNEEPDCEIIRIENEGEVEEQKEASSKFDKDSFQLNPSIEAKQLVKARARSVEQIKPSVVRFQQSHHDSQSYINSPLSTTLPLPLIASSLSKVKALSGNKLKHHRMLMVLPVNPTTSVQSGSPTLCTLHSIGSLTKVPNVKEIVENQHTNTKVSNRASNILPIPIRPKPVKKTNKKIMSKAISINRTECKPKKKDLSTFEKSPTRDIFFMGKKVGERISLSKSKDVVNKIGFQSQASLQSMSKKSSNNLGSIGNQKTQSFSLKDSIIQNNSNNTESSLSARKKIVSNFSSEKTTNVFSKPVESIINTSVKSRKRKTEITEPKYKIISSSAENFISESTKLINDISSESQKNAFSVSQEPINKIVADNRKSLFSVRKDAIVNVENKKSLFSIPKESKNISENKKSLFSLRKEPILTVTSEIPTHGSKEPTINVTSGKNKSQVTIPEEPIIHISSGDDNNFISISDESIINLSSEPHIRLLPATEKSLIHFNSEDQNSYILLQEDQNNLYSILKDPTINVKSENLNSFIAVSNEPMIEISSFNENTLISVSEMPVDNVTCFPDQNSLSFLTQSVNNVNSFVNQKNAIPRVEDFQKFNSFSSQKRSISTSTETNHGKICSSSQNFILNRSEKIDFNCFSHVQKNPKISVMSQGTQTENIDAELTKTDVPIKKIRIVSPDKKSPESLSNNQIPANSWKSHCVVCKELFTDRYELHKHASLMHPQVQMVFCEYCSVSFLTDRELKEHRILTHNRKIERTEYSVPEITANQQNLFVLKRKFLKRRKIANYCVEINESRTNKTLPSLIPSEKRIAACNAKSRKWLQIEESNARQIRNVLKHNYVDNDVIRHTSVLAKENFESAEIRKLIVRVPKLDGPELAKYLEKHDKKPVIPRDVNKAKKSGYLRKSDKAIARSSKESKYIENVRRSDRIKRPSTKKLLREEYERIRNILKQKGKRKDQNWTFKHDTDGDTDEMPNSSSGNSQSFRIISSQSCTSDDDTKEIIVDDLPSDYDNRHYQTDDEKSVCSFEIEFEKRVDKNDEETHKKMEDCKRIELEKDENCEISKNLESLDNDKRSNEKEQSEFEVDIVIERPTSDPIAKERQVIRKLTSRSSAASVVTLKYNRRSHENFEIPGKTMSDTQSEKGLSDYADTESNCSSTRRINRKLRKERSIKKKSIQDHELSKDNNIAEEHFRYESKYDEASKRNQRDQKNGNNYGLSDYESENGGRDEEYESNMYQQTRIETENNSKKFESPVKSTLYSQDPNNHESEIVVQLKEQWNDTNIIITRDLCSICNELICLMKKLTPQFEGNGKRKNPVKCPFCNLFFIVEFYLEEHIADKHLHCEKQRACKEAKISGFSRYWTTGNADSNCDSSIAQLAFECRNCLMKFDTEKNLNDHAIAKHDTQIPSKESFVTETPDYLKNLPSFCFESPCDENMMDTPPESPESFADLIPNHSAPQSGDKVISLGKSTEVGKESKVSDDKTKSILSHDCALCEATFMQRAEYIRHVRKSHNPLKVSSEGRKKQNSPELWDDNQTFSSDESCISDTEDSPISAMMDTNNDQATADREYLLKQLLSDDSMDGFDDDDDKTVKKNSVLSHDSRKEINDNVLDQDSTKGSEIKVVDDSSSFHTCKICLKAFSTAQDLLVHVLQHEHETSGSNANFSEVTQTEMSSHYQELFADPLLDDCRRELESLDSSSMMSIEAECDAARKLSYRIHSDQDSNSDYEIFADYNEPKIDVPPKIVKQRNDKVTISSKRPGSILSHPESEKRSRPQKMMEQSKSRNRSDAKNSRATKRESMKPEASYQNEKRDTMKELLETEKGIVNPDAKTTNDKVSIECSKCNRKFVNQTALNEHLFFLHDDNLKDKVLTDVIAPLSQIKDTDESKKGWRCSGCSQHFKLQQTYSRHRYFMHGDESMVHVCENCCKVLTTVTMVNVHICMDVASYNCRTCNETFPTGMSLRLHNTEKHIATPGPHVCEPCNKNFLTKAMMDRHTKWKHRFFRPYRPRKTSPVRMATCQRFNNLQESSNKLYEDNESEIDNRLINNEFLENSSDLGTHMDSDPVIIQSRVENSLNLKKLKKREKLDNARESTKIRRNALKKSAAYVDEQEIFQCDFCDLYCLSKEALRSHMQRSARSHSVSVEICRLCRKSYAKGKIVRHMIDNHVIPCENYEMESHSIWKNTKDTSEKDAENFIKILGINRFISLCEYQRYTELTNNDSITCPSCDHILQSCQLYQEHFFSNHDTMCALCDIEFKSGKDAAKHKIQTHNSVESYLWFAISTVSVVKSSRNFNKTIERCFIEMISREAEENTFDQVSINEDDTVDDTMIEKSQIRIQEIESDSQVDEKLIVVVNDKDLEEYNIGTRYPNIWGLAAKISSTSRDFTPKDVKEMLELHFERNDDICT